MLNHGSNSTLLNWKTVKRDSPDKTHGMQSNHKSMKNKLLKGKYLYLFIELLKTRLSTDSKSTLARTYQPPLNSSAREIEVDSLTTIQLWTIDLNVYNYFPYISFSCFYFLFLFLFLFLFFILLKIKISHTYHQK
jgi:hypothetical protein